MPPRRRAVMARAVVLSMLVTLLLAASALAARPRPRPRVTWQVPPTATAGSAVSFSWTAKHLSRGSRLVVQQQTGTARVWKTIAKLPHAKGSGHLPGFPLGDYRLRIIALSSRHVLLAQQQRKLNVFGQVPFSAMFRDASGGIYTTPTRTFSYLIAADDLTSDGSAVTVVTDADNRCRSIHFDFIPGAEFNEGGETGTLAIVQETSDPVSASASFDDLGSLDAGLVPGRSWSVELSHSGGTKALTFYMNGWASCDSTEALSVSSDPF